MKKLRKKFKSFLTHLLFQSSLNYFYYLTKLGILGSILPISFAVPSSQSFSSFNHFYRCVIFFFFTFWKYKLTRKAKSEFLYPSKCSFLKLPPCYPPTPLPLADTNRLLTLYFLLLSWLPNHWVIHLWTSLFRATCNFII